MNFEEMCTVPFSGKQVVEEVDLYQTVPSIKKPGKYKIRGIE